MFTATGDQADLIDALESGADDFVGKEATTAELRPASRPCCARSPSGSGPSGPSGELAVLLEREREARAEAEAANLAKDQFLATCLTSSARP